VGRGVGNPSRAAGGRVSTGGNSTGSCVIGMNLIVGAKVWRTVGAAVCVTVGAAVRAGIGGAVTTGIGGAVTIGTGLGTMGTGGSSVGTNTGTGT
jgi:hypothetical protein